MKDEIKTPDEYDRVIEVMNGYLDRFDHLDDDDKKFVDYIGTLVSSYDAKHGD